MDMYKGLAIGGPLDGTSIKHPSPVYIVPEPTAPGPTTRSSLQALEEQVIEFDMFEYVHFKMHFGEFWIPDVVKKGLRYEHKVWASPLDYLLSKLIRAYRPDGY